MVMPRGAAEPAEMGSFWLIALVKVGGQQVTADYPGEFDCDPWKERDWGVPSLHCSGISVPLTVYSSPWVLVVLSESYGTVLKKGDVCFSHCKIWIWLSKNMIYMLCVVRTLGLGFHFHFSVYVLWAGFDRIRRWPTLCMQGLLTYMLPIFGDASLPKIFKNLKVINLFF